MNDRNRDLKRNASGYWDETCYKGITVGARPGEIWGHAEKDDYMLILAHAGNVNTVLKLDCKPREGKVQVLSRAPLYTDPLKISYCFDDNLTNYIRSVPDDEFAIIKRMIVRALGLRKEANE